MSEPTPKEGVSLFEQFGDRFFQLAISVRCYRGRHVMPAALVKTEVNATKVEVRRLAGNVLNLLPDDVLDEFGQLLKPKNHVLNNLTLAMQLGDVDEDTPEGDEDEEKSEIRKASAGRSLSGLRILSSVSAEEVFRTLHAVRAAIAEFVTRLQTRWDQDVIAYNRNYWLPILGGNEGQYQSLIGRRLPTARSLPRRYGLRWSGFRISPGVIANVAEGNLRKDLEDSAKAASAQLDKAFTRMLEEPKQRLLAALQRLDRQIRGGDSKVTEASFNEVRSAVSLIKSFGQGSTDELMNHITYVGEQIDAMSKAAEDRGRTSFKDFALAETSIASVVGEAIKRVEGDVGSRLMRRVRNIPRAVED